MSFWQKCIVVLLGMTILGGAGYFARLVFRPVGLDRYKSIPRVTYVHPNVKKLKRSRELVDEGKLDEARTILVKALLSAPHSPVTRDLRDLLGEVNTRIFFSKEPSPRKTEYTVKRGDALASIARRLKSSAEAIVRVNNLNSTLIRTGETLFVPQLDFTVTIDLPRERVVVHDSHGFFTQYPIVSAELPPARQPTIQTKVTAKLFWENGRPVRLVPGEQTDGTPRIDLGIPAICFMVLTKTVVILLPTLRSKPTIKRKHRTLAIQMARLRGLPCSRMILPRSSCLSAREHR